MSSVPHQRQRTDLPYFDGVMFRERRRSPRRPASGTVTGVVCDPAAPQRPHRICSLEMTNISQTGLGARSAEPLPTGATVALFIPPHGGEPGADLRGTVVRCRPRSTGHDIGIDFATPRRAA